MVQQQGGSSHPDSLETAPEQVGSGTAGESPAAAPPTQAGPADTAPSTTAPRPRAAPADAAPSTTAPPPRAAPADAAPAGMAPPARAAAGDEAPVGAAAPGEAGPVGSRLTADAPAGTPAARPDGARQIKIRRVVLMGLLGVALAVAIGFGVVGTRIVQQKDATLTPPDRASGLVRDKSDQAADTAEYLQAALAAEIDLDKTVGVVYDDPGSATRTVLFLGGTGLIFRPDAELDRAFTMLADKAGSVSGVREVPAGDLGGTMKCGVLRSPDGDMAACAWADHGSVAVAMFPGRTVDESAPLMRDLRGAIQKRA